MSQSGNCQVNVIKGFRAAGARLPSTKVALVWFIGLTLLCREASNRPTFLRDWPSQFVWLVYTYWNRAIAASLKIIRTISVQCGTLTNEISTWADFFCEKIVADKNNSVNNSVDFFWENHRDIQLGRHILWPTELNNLLTYFMTTGRGPLLLIMTADDNGWSDRAFFESLWNSMAISHQIREVW